VSAQSEQIQALIADIDDLLRQKRFPLPWGQSADASRSREVLERVRRYLASLHQSQVDLPQLNIRDVHPGSSQVAEGESSHPTLSEVERQLYVLHERSIEPMREDIENLRLERRQLAEQVQQLQRQRQQQETLAQQNVRHEQTIAQFLETLSDRLQATTNEHLDRALKQFEAQLLAQQTDVTTARENDTESGESVTPPLHPAERLARVRQLETESDRRLTHLDATLRLVFETLEQDLQSYRESLVRGIERLHNLGQQGEVAIAKLVEQLAEPLERGRPETTLEPESEAIDALIHAESPAPQATDESEDDWFASDIAPPADLDSEEAANEIDLELGAAASEETESSGDRAKKPRAPEPQSGNSGAEVEVERALFAGYEDPATSEESSETPPPAESPQSVERALFAQLGDREGAELEGEVPDTIATLTELLPPLEADSMSPSTAESTETPSVDDFAEDDAYLEAVPSEDLLMSDESQPSTRQPLNLDRSTLQQLESDLNDLEDLESDAEPSEPAIDSSDTAPEKKKSQRRSNPELTSDLFG
jgi:hypothetical protein